MIIWWLFDDYFQLFDYYLVIIWWLFGDYLMIIRSLIIWWLFDAYLMIICSFVQAHCCAHSSAAAISLSCWACLHCGLQTIGNLKPIGDGEADTESSTGLGFSACSGACFAAAGQSAWSRAMNSNQRLGGTLRSCLLQKACCGSYRQKWENGQPRNRVCTIHNMFSCVTTGTIHDLAEGCLRGAIHDPAEGHLNKTWSNTGAIHDLAEGHPCAHS